MVVEIRKEKKLSPKQVIEKNLKKVRGKKLDVNKYSGKIKFADDPVAYQRKLRDEWK